ncbi:SMI1/KNR4 family protein [Streptomyces sp. NPDC003691]
MRPDPGLLRDMIASVPGITVEPDGAKSAAAIRATEAVTGPLGPSYRWWLAEYGEGALDGAPVATVAPLHRIGSIGLLDGWHGGDRLPFHHEGDGGDSYAFDLTAAGPERPVVRRDHFTGEEERIAESFAGFLSVWAARALGLRDGPNPAVAALWRTASGAVLPGGTVVYGPALFRERNERHGIAERAPHWVLAGDDGAGTGLFMRRHGRDRASVYRLAIGEAANDIGERGTFVTDDLCGWLGRTAGDTPDTPGADLPDC